MGTLLVSNAIPLVQLSVGFASVGASFSLIGTFTAPVEMMYIISTFNQPVQLSFDGANNHIVIPSGNSEPVYFPINFKTNRTIFPTPSVFVEEIGSAPTSGNLYVCAFSAAIP
jgi:hypothetical protein